MSFSGSRSQEFSRPPAWPAGVDTRTLTGAVTMTAVDGLFHQLDPGGASRDVTMYAGTIESKGRVEFFYNSADAAEDLVIKQAAGTTIVTLGQSQSCALVDAGDGTWALAQRGAATVSSATDTISEVTPAAGVTVDGMLIKDGGILIADSATVKFGTPGTDVVFTSDGADVVITGTGVLYTVDSMALAFGTGKDIAASWDGTRLNVTQATVNSEIRWGVDGAGLDQMWYGDTASAYLLWDQSADSLILGGTAKIKAQTIEAATGTAIPVTHSGSFPITQNGAETNSLADPTFLGQWLSIFVDTDTSGARVITAASRINQAANTTITLTEVGDFIKLEAITIGGALKWQVIANDGAVLS